MLRRWLTHPLTKGLDVNDPRTTALRRRIVREKPFLNRIYGEWYGGIVSALPSGEGSVLELGSGGGFLEDYIPKLITSEIFHLPYVRAVVDGTTLPFAGGSLRGIVMTDVFHHVPQVRSFFTEAIRCLRPGGAVIMIEPWLTRWSAAVYSKLHHEPWVPDASDWGFPSTGPLSGANSALPWIIFERDRALFEKEFPELRISSVVLSMPFRYLLCGGVSLRSTMPAISFGFWRFMEGLLEPWMGSLAMFARIKLIRT